MSQKQAPKPVWDLDVDGNQLPKDGHDLYATEKSDFYKERFRSEDRSRQKFRAGTQVHYTSRNTILAEPTPRSSTFTASG
eukprot:CAMPEP_0182464618 /NCGR_PEP_ID=MMETSP1319-20130603/8746_1 /TAXON_ID=172717 /ORGANISM="Bolidomonas pacifica, Strain RCC208" /LENGTH=79 /DNA_ID=CAMNT_0024664275 /DNA_START=201 /DNA_END=437 /DNA_ORIENTATION=+